MIDKVVNWMMGSTQGATQENPETRNPANIKRDEIVRTLVSNGCAPYMAEQAACTGSLDAAYKWIQATYHMNYRPKPVINMDVRHVLNIFGFTGDMFVDIVSNSNNIDEAIEYIRKVYNKDYDGTMMLYIQLKNLGIFDEHCKVAIQSADTLHSALTYLESNRYIDNSQQLYTTYMKQYANIHAELRRRGYSEFSATEAAMRCVQIDDAIEWINKYHGAKQGSTSTYAQTNKKVKPIIAAQLVEMGFNTEIANMASINALTISDAVAWIDTYEQSQVTIIDPPTASTTTTTTIKVPRVQHNDSILVSGDDIEQMMQDMDRDIAMQTAITESKQASASEQVATVPECKQVSAAEQVAESKASEIDSIIDIIKNLVEADAGNKYMRRADYMKPGNRIYDSFNERNSNNIPVVTLFINADNVNIHYNGYTLFHIALKYCQTDILHDLIEKNIEVIDMTICPHDTMITYIMMALEYCDDDIVVGLLQKPTNPVDCIDAHGNHTITYAINYKPDSVQVFRELLQYSYTTSESKALTPDIITSCSYDVIDEWFESSKLIKYDDAFVKSLRKFINDDDLSGHSVIMRKFTPTDKQRGYIMTQLLQRVRKMIYEDIDITDMIGEYINMTNNTTDAIIASV